ncbi:MAG: hypothetical protein RIQ60_2686 [Pseudomonadota bacterium]|jgi:uncharacterized protein (DUF1684 family)
MLPPVLEIYGIWHPDDDAGSVAVKAIEQHFHGTACAGLLRGTVEVYRRSEPWQTHAKRAASSDDTAFDTHPALLAPRPIALPGDRQSPPGLPTAAAWVAVVIVVGPELVDALGAPRSPWFAYLKRLLDAAERRASRVKCLPMLLPGTRLAIGSAASSLLGWLQAVGQRDALLPPLASETHLHRGRCRDVAQVLASWMDPRVSVQGDAGERRLQVFISHTKHRSNNGDERVGELISLVRQVLGNTRLGTFYDANDLQASDDWAKALRSRAARCAVLAVRTDQYASREWCQREVLIAKQQGHPVVMLDALTDGELRGSFLLDHVPRMPARDTGAGGPAAAGDWSADRVEQAINQLVDAWLQRVLWERLREMAEVDGHAAYAGYQWVPHAPEPATLALWLSPDAEVPESLRLRHRRGQVLRLLHPDPPMASDEQQVLARIARLAGVKDLELTTPRLLAARGA